MNKTFLITNGFDFFVAAMLCQHCGRVSPADESTNMQTYLRDEPQMERLGVGSDLGDSFHDLEDKRYATVHPGHDSINLLDTWSCPFCGHQNWASISIESGIITDISAKILDRNTLLNSNYISEDASSLAVDLSGASFIDVMKAGTVDILLKFLK